MKRTVIILKWIFILPICILGSYLLPYITTIGLGLYINPDDKFWRFLINLISQFSQGGIFVGLSYAIAPKFKKETIFVFLILLFIYVLLLAYYLITNNVLEYIDWFGCLLLISGGIYGYFYTKKETNGFTKG
jgi:hypothetical protein